jgi:hypothetical protein
VPVLVTVAIIIGFLSFPDELPKPALFLALLAIFFVYVTVRYDDESPEAKTVLDDRRQ